MDAFSLAWLAGLLEGEGSFMFGPPSAPNQARVSLSMTDEDVVRRAAALMGVTYLQKVDRRPGEWKPSYVISVRGRPALRLMRELLPHMGLRRAERIRAILAQTIDRAPGDNTRKLTVEQLQAIALRLTSGDATEKIGSEFGVSGRTVRKIRAKIGMQLTPENVEDLLGSA